MGHGQNAQRKGNYPKSSNDFAFDPKLEKSTSPRVGITPIIVAELASKHELHPTQIAARKREAVEKLAKVFDEKGSGREQNRAAELTTSSSSGYGDH